MPITPFLNDENFDQETTRVLGVALELTCVALRTGDCADDVKQAIANKIIALAKAGERNPDILCEQVLKDICRPQMRNHSRPRFPASPYVSSAAAANACSSASARNTPAASTALTWSIRRTPRISLPGNGMAFWPPSSRQTSPCIIPRITAILTECSQASA